MKQLNFYQIFNEKFSKSKIFAFFLNQIASGNNMDISGLQGSGISLFIHFLYQTINKPIILVIPDQQESEQIRDDLDYLMGDSYIGFLPNFEKETYFDIETDSINNYFVNDTLNKISINDKYIIITTPEGSTAPFPKKENYDNTKIILSVNSEYNRDKLIIHLQDFGYSRVETVECPLEYSVKGAILDFFPPAQFNPVRLEFFGDTIESIRIFNKENQCSIEQISEVKIHIPANIQKNDNITIKNWLPENSLIFNFHYDTNSQDYKELQISNLGNQQYINCHDIENEFTLRLIKEKINSRSLDVFKNHLANILNQQPDALIYITCHHKFHVKRLSELLKAFSIQIIEANFSTCVSCSDIDLYIFPENEIYHREKTSLTFRKLSQEFNIEKSGLEDYQYGDFIVHIKYGIGKYLGLNKITAFKSIRECVTLEYKNGDKIYIPQENLKDIQKYKNPEDYTPLLTSLNSTEWERKKMRTRKSLEKITKEIIQLYAERMNSEGFAFEPDGELQKEMESEFTYEETPDQLNSAEQIKNLMESDHPMDLLLCGDVGFGKTEVAIRAAFKAVLSSKQVIVLTPTTILSDQHLKSFRERLANYPVRVEMISRFVKKSQQTKIIEKTKKGEVDILIGTHRLLSPDIEYKDLGLLIIDEEHRFGVKHKEKIKNLRKNIDVISLSATPIPRTLQFSLMGARDFAQINTPPKFRLPIYTSIIHFDKNKLKEYVNREISRSGQIFFVHNEVKTIAHMTSQLIDLFPKLRIAYAHGQMTEKELEPIMNSFINYELDILVTTSIIESGIDIPNANSIFINKAHKFGLAQLYQLRGRVGRGSRRAYCYLIIPKTGSLKPDAVERLNTIRRYTSLGSGYSIALKDMEIRGTGNLFGLEQSGNIQSLGYDMYIKILKEALDEEKEKNNLDFLADETLPDIDIKHQYNAYFPDTYIDSTQQRLDLYKRLAHTNKISEVEKIQSEVKDRFGKIPSESITIFKLAQIRVLAARLNIKKLHMIQNHLKIILNESAEISDPAAFLATINSAVNQLNLQFKMIPDETFSFLLYFKDQIDLDSVKQFLLLLK